mgnify:CR=1 FL=1
MPKVKGEINLFLDLSHKKHGKNEKCTGNSRESKEKFMGNNVNPAGKILLIATGGTLEAAVHLVEQLGAKVVKIVCLLELKGLHGRDRLTSCPTEAVVSYEGK